VNALAPELNTMLLTCVKPERETAVVLETLKVAVSDGPLGYPVLPVSGVQFVLVFQLLVKGERFHVALPA
jgi:hypothetical protein